MEGSERFQPKRTVRCRRGVIGKDSCGPKPERPGLVAIGPSSNRCSHGLAAISLRSPIAPTFRREIVGADIWDGLGRSLLISISLWPLIMGGLHLDRILYPCPVGDWSRIPMALNTPNDAQMQTPVKQKQARELQSEISYELKKQRPSCGIPIIRLGDCRQGSRLRRSRALDAGPVREQRRRRSRIRPGRLGPGRLRGRGSTMLGSFRGPGCRCMGRVMRTGASIAYGPWFKSSPRKPTETRAWPGIQVTVTPRSPSRATGQTMVVLTTPAIGFFMTGECLIRHASLLIPGGRRAT